MEPSLSARGEVLLKQIEKAGVEEPKEVVRTLRDERVEACGLRDLTDEQLRQLFPKIGVYNRMKKFIVRSSGHFS